jgi:hypothetical protein
MPRMSNLVGGPSRSVTRADFSDNRTQSREHRIHFLHLRYLSAIFVMAHGRFGSFVARMKDRVNATQFSGRRCAGCLQDPVAPETIGARIRFRKLLEKAFEQRRDERSETRTRRQLVHCGGGKVSRPAIGELSFWFGSENSRVGRCPLIGTFSKFTDFVRRPCWELSSPPKSLFCTLSSAAMWRRISDRVPIFRVPAEISKRTSGRAAVANLISHVIINQSLKGFCYQRWISDGRRRL